MLRRKSDFWSKNEVLLSAFLRPIFFYNLPFSLNIQPVNANNNNVPF